MTPHNISIRAALTTVALCLLSGNALRAAEASAESTASLRLHALFTDHMVLQRDRPCPVWGWAAPGQTVNVSVSGLNTTGTTQATATAGPDGKWSSTLGPFSAGGPCTLTVASPTATRTLNDILVGEVWICSGQSNMDWQVIQSQNPQACIASSSNNQIRLFAVPHRSVPLPLQDIPDASPWQLCGPDSVTTFSAVAYHFGQELNRRLKVPVGLIKTAAGGTPAEAWTSREGLQPFPEFTEQVALLNAEPADPGEAKALFDRREAEWKKQFTESDPGYDASASSNGTNTGSASSWKWIAPDVDTASWKSLQVPGKWEEQGHPPFDGTVWLRREIELPETTTGNLTLNLGPVDDQAEVWFNGHSLSKGPAKTRKYKVPGKAVRSGRNVVTIRVTDVGGGGGFNGAPEEFSLVASAAPGGAPVSLAGEWKIQYGADLSRMPPLPRPPGNWHRPTGLHNGMIAPLVPYAVRGAIWYQGESNASRAWRYRELFPAMIGDWRRLWNQGEFPFLFVQLASFMAPQPEPADHDWAELRDAQLHSLHLPNTGMASAVDIGETHDIHPRNKQDVGIRLARAARAIAYGEPIEWSGPLYSRMETEKNAIRLHFTHLGGGLVTRGGVLKGFAIAGEDRKFVWADARIDGDTVVVSSPSVPQPVAVRYAWAANPEATLYNREELPASPFRTDDWPLLTRDAR